MFLIEADKSNPLFYERIRLGKFCSFQVGDDDALRVTHL